MEPEVEAIFAQGEMLRARLGPTLEVVREAGQRRCGRFRGRLESLRKGPLALVHPQRHAHLVQQRRAVDLFIQLGGVCLFESGGERLQGGEVGGEGGVGVVSVTVVEGGDPRLGSRHRVHVPAQIEVGAFHLPQSAYRHAACFKSRWHSSSVSTRSVRFAASNSALQAASSSPSYPCVCSQNFTFERPDTGEISIFCSSPSSSAGTEL